MGRPPSNGGPAFRFNSAEVLEMETILQDHNNMMPAREVLVSIADKFSNSPERRGKFVVQTKQIWNWFQNKRYAIRARTSKTPTKLIVSSMQPTSTIAPLHAVPVISTMPAEQAKPTVPVAPSAQAIPVVTREDNFSSSGLPQSVAAPPGRSSADNIPMEFEARSARDGAWYDVTAFLSLKNLEAGDPEVLVRFAGFGPEEDEWINVRKHVRHRSLPCESSECVAVLPGDLILCFQEGKEQALYFDAHVLDAQRRRHDVRGCRCRFLVRYDHDQSEEIVPLRKICRRPETDYRLLQLHAMNESSAEHRKSTSSTEQHKSTSSTEQHKSVSSVEQIKSHIDSPFPKAGICNFSALSTQKALAPNLHVNVSEISEEHKGATDCSSDKTIGDTNIAPSRTQHSLPEVINLDPEIEVERNTHEVKNVTDDMAVDEKNIHEVKNVTDDMAVDEKNIHEVKGANDDDMAVDEPLEKPFLTVEETDVMPICGIDATTKTCLTVVKPSSEMNGTTSQNATQVVKKEVSVATGTGNVPVAGGHDPELMMVERNSTTDEGQAKFDPIKADLTSSTDLNLTREMKIPETSLLAGAEVISADSSIPAGKSSEITNITLESGVPDEGGVTHEVKTDVDLANANPA